LSPTGHHNCRCTPANRPAKIGVEAHSIDVPHMPAGLNDGAFRDRVAAPSHLTLVAADVAGVGKRLPKAERCEWRADRGGKRLATPGPDRNGAIDNRDLATKIDEA
jgi:hypothetical protein